MDVCVTVKQFVVYREKKKIKSIRDGSRWAQMEIVKNDLLICVMNNAHVVLLLTVESSID